MIFWTILPRLLWTARLSGVGDLLGQAQAEVFFARPGWVGCSLAVHSTGGGRRGRLGTLSDRPKPFPTHFGGSSRRRGLLIFRLRQFGLCFPGWSWYHSNLDCQAGWGSLRFLGRKRIGTYNSQNSFQDVLGPFCIGWLLRLGEAGNSRSAFNWRQRGITFSFFSQMTPSFGSEPPLHMRCRQI